MGVRSKKEVLDEKFYHTGTNIFKYKRKYKSSSISVEDILKENYNWLKNEREHAKKLKQKRKARKLIKSLTTSGLRNETQTTQSKFRNTGYIGYFENLKKEKNGVEFTDENTDPKDDESYTKIENASEIRVSTEEG